jgi:AraC-like DNA-binding protein
MPLFVVFFWLILFLLNNQTRDLPKRFLTVFLVVVFINYLGHQIYFTHNYVIYKVFDGIWVFTSLSVYPIYYYYLRLLTVDKRIQFKWSWILLPAISLSIFTAIIYLLMNPNEIDRFIQEILYHNREVQDEYNSLIQLQIFRINLFKIVFVIEVLLTLIFGLRLIADFNKKIRAIYSNIDNKEIPNVRMLLFFLVLTAVISGVSNLIGKDFFIDYPYMLVLPSIAHSIALFGICYVGYNQNFTISNLEEDQFIGEHEDIHEESKAESMVGLEFDRLYLRIKELFEKEKLFKDSELKMNDLALRLGTNRTYVSRLIHERTNKSFCDFVNDYRVIHAEELLSSPNEFSLSIEKVAFESGFSGISSFYRAIVKKNGIPPGKYRKMKIANFVEDEDEKF